MKNKKTLYFVVPALIVIWGLIFYKVFNALSPKEDLESQVYQNLENQPIVEKSDTFSIYADYPDPFLSGVPKENSQLEASSSENISTPKPPVIKPQINWPQISYSGMIKNQKSNKQLALIQVNGKENIAPVGSNLEGGISIHRIFKDSVEVSFNKEKKFIKKGR